MDLIFLGFQREVWKKKGVHKIGTFGELPGLKQVLLEFWIWDLYQIRFGFQRFLPSDDEVKIGRGI